MIFEICVDSVEGVRAAARAGARRVELCANLLEGGTTPSLGMIRRARTVEGVRLQVIVRPRGGDFLYSEDEFAAMRDDVLTAKSEGTDGVVFGVLDPDGCIDEPRTAALIALARPMAVTFHRAFDMARDPLEALETLIRLGADRVLTSGQEASALEGLPLIAELERRAAGRMVVMPGGGITPRNVQRIVAATGVREIHFAALSETPSAMRFRRADVFMGGELRASEYARPTTSAELIGRVIEAASG